MDISYSNNFVADWRNFVSNQKNDWNQELERLEKKSRKNSEEYAFAQKATSYFLGAEREFIKILDKDMYLSYEDDYVHDWVHFYYGSIEAANLILGISEFYGGFNFKE